MMNQTNPWIRTTVQMVEETLRGAQHRLAGSYRNRLTDLASSQGAGEKAAPAKPTTIPQLAEAFARKLKPMLRTLNPVTDERSFRLARHAIDRSLVAIEILSEDDVEQLSSIERLTGEDIRRLMRLHDVSIRDVSASLQITLKRVREVREKGVQGRCMSRDWYEGITRIGVFAGR